MYFKSIEFLLSTDTKESASMQETQVQSLGLEDLLEKGRAIHSSVLGWRAPLTEESGGLQHMQWQAVRSPELEGPE